MDDISALMWALQVRAYNAREQGRVEYAVFIRRILQNCNDEHIPQLYEGKEDAYYRLRLQNQERGLAPKITKQAASGEALSPAELENAVNTLAKTNEPLQEDPLLLRVKALLSTAGSEKYAAYQQGSRLVERYLCRSISFEEYIAYLGGQKAIGKNPETGEDVYLVQRKEEEPLPQKKPKKKKRKEEKEKQKKENSATKKEEGVRQKRKFKERIKLPWRRKKQKE
ncbi:hypothetical protein HYS49_00425 [Candidatus Woesearchaeota archaeon]|nr:hypothetical protein [Candidatus Woesearchaeota archaeon]